MIGRGGGVQYIIMQQQVQAESPFITALLLRFEQDESEATREVIERICQDDPHRPDYLRAFNILLNSRTAHARQRRDLAAIARLIADSSLASALLPALELEASSGQSILPHSLTIQLTKLIGNVCNQNPHLIDNILVAAPGILPFLCGLYCKAETTPVDAECLTAVVSFLHNISLKETSLREERVAPCLQALLLNVLTDSRFCPFISQKRFQSFVSSLFKFHANVPLVALGVYTALIKSARALNEQYKALAEAFKGMANRLSSVQQRNFIIQRAGLADKKLIAIMRLFQKAKSNIFAKFNAFSFNALLKIFVKIAIMRPVALLNQPIENKLLVNIISELMTSIQEYKDHLEATNFLPEPLPPPVRTELQGEEAEGEQGQGGTEVLPPVQQQRINFTPSQVQRFKAEFRYFQSICEVTRHFSDTYFKIIKSTIETLAVSFERVHSPSSPEMEETIESRNFLIAILTVRLQRILGTMLKLFSSQELSRGSYYRQIVSLLLKLLPAYYQRAVQAQSKAILEELPKMDEICTESQSSVMRFIMESIDEQSVKTFIQGKLLEKINIFGTIYEAIIKFVYHLTDQQHILNQNMKEFIHVFIAELKRRHLDHITASTTITLKQIEALRLALRVATELFHNSVSLTSEEQLKEKTKLYRYCRLLEKDGGENGLFRLLAIILNNLQKHRIEDTSQLPDTPSNRQEVAKTIFAKIIVQRTKAYINFLTLSHMVRLDPDLPYDPHPHPNSETNYLTDHYHGYFSYLTVFNDFISRTCSSGRFVLFKEEVLGVAISRTLDYQLHVRQGGSEQAQRVEDGLLREMKERVDVASNQMITWMMENGNRRIHRLPLLTKKVLHFQKIGLSARIDDYAASIHQQQLSHVQNFIRLLSMTLNRASLLLTNQKLDLKIKLPRVQWTEEEVDIKGEIQRVANAVIMLGQTIKLLAVEEYLDDPRLLIAPNYLYSLLRLVSALLVNFKAEEEFPDQADQLIHASLWFLENYIHYDSHLKQLRISKRHDWKMAKKIALKQELKRRKMTKKGLLRGGKEEDQGEEAAVEESNELDEDGEEIAIVTPQRKRRRRRNRHRKHRPRSEQPVKTLQKSNSKPNLLSVSQARTENNKKNRTPGKQQKVSALQRAIQSYLKEIIQLLGSCSTPLIKNDTMGYLITFLSRHMRRNIVQAPPFRNFQVSIGEITAPLLKILVREARIPGYHFSLCKLGLQLFDDNHIKVDYQLAIKRYLYEQEGDITLAQFMKLLRDNFKDVTQSTANFVEIVVQGDSKRYPFVKEHYDGLLMVKNKKLTVVLKEGVQLHLLNTKPEASRRKSSEQNANRHIKVSDYSPQGELFVFIEQLITHSIHLLLGELDRCIQGDPLPPYKSAMEPFTIRTVIQTLQYLVRQSPSLGPFVAKFKCRRILLAEMGNERLKNKEAVTACVLRAVAGGSNLPISPQSIQEIGFLSVLIRLFSPLVVNAISGLVFELCLDSTPLVQVAQGGKKGSHVPFGSVIRLKVVQELAGIMFDPVQLQWMFRKLCLLNMITVLINIKEMARLFLDNSFISKLYTQYEAIRGSLETAWREESTNNNLESPPSGSLITRIVTPFYLTPLAILQELNISFHYNKKLNKSGTKVCISTVLNRQSINAQLIPADSLKKYRFKLDWPFHQRRDGQHPLEQPQPDQDEYYANEENSSQSDNPSQQEDSEDSENSSLQLDRLGLDAQLQEDLDSYMSMELDEPHGGLLNQQWDYSSDPQMDHDYPSGEDPVIEIGDQIMDLEGGNSQEEDGEGNEEQGDEEDEDQGDEDDEEGLENDNGQSADEEGERVLNQYLEAQDMGDSHMNSSSLINQLNALPSHSHSPSLHSQVQREFALSPVNQQDYYISVNALLNFQKVQSIPRISKAEKRQVHLLRFFLQLVSYPSRLDYNRSHPRTKTVHEEKEETQVEQGQVLWAGFRKDEHIRNAQFVQYEQIYRYDHFHKQTPKLAQQIQKQFSDEVQAPRRLPIRRNAIVARDNLIEIMPGWNITEVRPDPHSSAEPIDDQQMPLGEEGESHLEIDSQQDDDIDEIDGESNSIVEMRGAQVTEAQHLANITEILRAANLAMTARQFMRLDRETQQDILINIAEQSDLHSPRPQQQPLQLTPRNSPVSFVEPADQEAVDMDIPNLQIRSHDPLSQGRIIEPLSQRNPAPEDPQGPEPQLQEMGNEMQVQEAGGQPVDEVYRKMSLQHSKKVSKDVIQALNKQGKNNSKFHELSYSQLQQLLDLLYLTSDQEHSKYPYPLIETLCLNTVSLGRILASLVALLHLTPSYTDLERIVKEGHRIIRLPYCQTRQEQEIDYTVRAYPSLAMKALHLLQHLTKNYSISMALLRPNNDLPSSLTPLIRPEQATLSSFQMLISLLREQEISRSPSILGFLIGVLDNITMHHFYKNVHEIVQRTAQEEERARISEDSVFLLGQLLQSDDVKENLPLVSKIIMRLSVEEHNLRNFIGFLEQLVQKLTEQALTELQERRQEGVGNSSQPPLKIVNIMAIFYEMVKAFETFPTTIDRHEEVMLALRRIVEFQRLQELCQKAVRGVFELPPTTNTPHPHPHPRAGQLIDCFFVLFEIATITSTTYRRKTQKQDQHNHIAQLGELEIGQLRGMAIEQEELLLGRFNLSALWREAVAHPTFKQYVNANIRKKMAQSGRRGSPFDLPIIKIAAATPHLLSFDNKYALFKVELKRLRGKAKYQPIHISLRRQDVFQSSFQQLMTRSGQKLRGKLKIEFQEQQGQDAGGVTREWFQLLSREMFNPNYGLFRSGSAGHTYHPSPSSYFNERHLDYFKFIGRIAGKALYDGYLLDAYFTPAFYKHILALPITFRDMQQEDYEYFKSLSWILENSPIESFLELTFTYDCDNFGEIQTKELVPHGAELAVTEENKLQYVQLIAYAKMATSIKLQLEAFLTGLHQLVPHRLLRIFSEKELEIMISGRPTIDIEDLRRNTELVNYMRNDPIIVWLFEVLESFDMELRTAFIQFVTGSSRVPVEGFKDLRGMNGVQRFNIHREFQEERLPRAHTCFNQLDLPNYKTKEILIEKLSYAITEGKEGFGMI